MNSQQIKTTKLLDQEWQTRKLGELCIFQRGLTYSKKDEVAYSSNCVLRANNVCREKHTINFDELKYIKDEVIVPDSKKIKKDAILICTASGSKSHLGKIALVGDDLGYAFGGFMGQIIPKAEIFPKYLYYALTSETYKNFIETLSDGVNINNLRFDELSNFQISFPSLVEQKRIVEILDKVFADIEKAKENTQKNLQNSRELFETHLESSFSNHGTNWKEKKLKDIGQIQTGTTPKTSNKAYYGDFVPFIKPADVDFFGAGAIRYDNEGLSEIGLEFGRKIKANSVLMVCIGASIGKVGFADQEVSCNQQINTLTVNNDLAPKFFYYALKTKGFYQKVLLNAGQATLPIISKGKWENLKISFSDSLDEQKEIVKKLDELSEQTKKLEEIYQKKLDNLEELKKSILKKAFEGKL